MQQLHSFFLFLVIIWDLFAKHLYKYAVFNYAFAFLIFIWDLFAQHLCKLLNTQYLRMF